MKTLSLKWKIQLSITIASTLAVLITCFVMIQAGTSVLTAEAVNNTQIVDKLTSAMITNTIWLVLIVTTVATGIAYFVQTAIVKPVEDVADALRDIAEGNGDLTRRLPVIGHDEISELSSSFNRFIEQVHTIIGSVTGMAEGISESTTMLAQLSQENERTMTLQQADVRQVVTGIKEMAGVVGDVSQSVTEAADNSLQADKVASNGKAIVSDTMGQIENLSSEIKSASDVIDRLRQDTVGIGSVLDVIRGIAEQTNLLALNAAIEAARAGEQGRGFAVVADEVRTLASRTQSSTTEIQEMIERLQTGAQEAVEMMAEGTTQADTTVEKAGEATSVLEDITHLVSQIRDRTNQIAAATEEQSTATQQIEMNVDSISHVAENTAESSRRITSNCTNLTEMATEMMQLVGRFKV